MQLAISAAERRYDLARVADLKYGAVPELEKKIKMLTEEKDKLANTNRILREVVGPEQIAEVVARWTGIPVSKLSQSEREKVWYL